MMYMSKGTNESADVSTDFAVRRRPSKSVGNQKSLNIEHTKYNFAAVQYTDNFIPWSAIFFDLKKF